jgi:hypothetical protein
MAAVLFGGGLHAGSIFAFVDVVAMEGSAELQLAVSHFIDFDFARAVAAVAAAGAFLLIPLDVAHDSGMISPTIPG